MLGAVGGKGAAMSSGRKRGQIEASRKKLKEIQKQLRERKKAQGLEPAANATLPNRVCGYESVTEEKQARLEAVSLRGCGARPLAPKLDGPGRLWGVIAAVNPNWLAKSSEDFPTVGSCSGGRCLPTMPGASVFKNLKAVGRISVIG